MLKRHFTWSHVYEISYKSIADSFIQPHKRIPMKTRDFMRRILNFKAFFIDFICVKEKKKTLTDAKELINSVHGYSK